MNIDANFEQLLDAENQKFKEAKEFDDFTPPEGRYVMVLTELDAGTYNDKKTGESVIRVNPSLQIVAENDETVHDRTFRPFFSGKAWGAFKTFAREALGGDLPGSLKDILSALEDKIGTAYEVQVEKSGNFTNIHLLRTLETAEPAVDAEPAPAE